MFLDYFALGLLFFGVITLLNIMALSTGVTGVGAIVATIIPVICLVYLIGVKGEFE